jgi:hypothetical protein
MILGATRCGKNGEDFCGFFGRSARELRSGETHQNPLAHCVLEGAGQGRIQEYWHPSRQFAAVGQCVNVKA